MDAFCFYDLALRAQLDRWEYDRIEFRLFEVHVGDGPKPKPGRAVIIARTNYQM